MSGLKTDAVREALSADELRAVVREACEPFVNRTNSIGLNPWCAEHQVNPSHVSEFLSGKRGPSADLLHALDLEVAYRPRSALSASGSGMEIGIGLTQVPASGVEPDALTEMEARKDAAYLERNQVVAALAKVFPSGVARTAIPGWSDDWHGCVYIDLPTGQVSWHFHDSQAYLFDGLPAYGGAWDGHDTPEKYRRLAALSASPSGDAPKALAAEARSSAVPSPEVSDELPEDWDDEENVDLRLSARGAWRWQKRRADRLEAALSSSNAARERAAEDERDRLYEAALKEVESGFGSLGGRAAANWLESRKAMRKADRAALRARNILKETPHG